MLRCFRVLRVRIPRLIGRILRWRCGVCEGDGWLPIPQFPARALCSWCSGTGYNIEGPRGLFQNARRRDA